MKTTLIVALILLLSACSSVPTRDDNAKSSGNLGNINLVKSELIQLHREWVGTPYRLGGSSKSGIDCSAFVMIGFESRFGITLPRTTAEQRTMGESVSRSELRPGDLVFFKTGWSTRHVGIYIGNHQFLHASTSQGVMLSSLNNHYWQQKYWLARRL